MSDSLFIIYLGKQLCVNRDKQMACPYFPTVFIEQVYWIWYNIIPFISS